MISLLLGQVAAEKEGIAVLGLDFKALLLQSGVFLILFLIIKKYALRGIVDALEKRRVTIDKGVTLGVEMQAAQAKFNEELKGMQKQARSAADDILSAAHTEANKIIKDGETKASQKVDDMLKDAKGRIEREMQTARIELRGEMLSLVSEATEVIINEKIDAKKDASLIERALAKVRA